MKIVKRNKNTWALKASNDDIIEMQKTYLELTLIHDEFIAEYKLYEFFNSNWSDEHKIIYEKRKEDYSKYSDDEYGFYFFAPFIFRYDFLEICKQANIPVLGVERMSD